MTPFLVLIIYSKRLASFLERNCNLTTNIVDRPDVSLVNHASWVEKYILFITEHLYQKLEKALQLLVLGFKKLGSNKQADYFLH